MLLHMAEVDQPMTSEALASMMQTNPVVIRRVLAGLREYGFVRSGKGHGGGWSLAISLDKLSLFDVYQALGSPSILALEHRTETPGCLVEEAVNKALGKAFADAEAMLMTRFKDVTLAQLSRDFHHGMVTRKNADK